MNAEKSYAQKVREEIFNLKPIRFKNYKAFCYGILLMSKQFDQSGIALSTEHLTVSKLYGFAVRDCCDVRPAFALEKKSRGVEIYTATLENKTDVTRLMNFFDHTESVNRDLLENENFSAFLTGTFLACGSVSEPEKGYHLEFIPPNDELCDLLFEILAVSGYPAKSSRRRKQTVLYFKESTQIEDILTMMGAIRCSLELMETKIYKDLRNSKHR